MALAFKGASRRILSRVLAALWISAFAITSSGCSLLMGAAAKDLETIETSSGEIVVEVSLRKPVFRPGEAMVVEVTVINTTDGPLRIRPLNATPGPPNDRARGSLGIWYGPSKGGRRMQRFPVVSKHEVDDMESMLNPTGSFEPFELAAGETLTRPFLMTRLTESVGAFVLQAHLRPFFQIDPKRTGTVFSLPAPFEVYGDPLFDRDSRGVIYMEEAMDLAAAAAPGDIVMTDAVLIEDEMGFLKWWINIDYREPGGEIKKQGYWIDPYQGRIWSKTKPFDETFRSSALVGVEYEPAGLPSRQAGRPNSP